MRDYFKQKEIIKEASKVSIMKAAFAERYIQVIKNRLYRYFTHSGSTSWTTIVPKIVEAINKSKCRTTGMRPIDVGFENAQELWQKLYGKSDNVKKPRYKPGTNVRMSYEKGKFTKGYAQAFTDEIVEVDKALPGNPAIYRIKDLKGEPMDARFYEEELQKVSQNNNPYTVQKKIRSRLVNGQREWLVTLEDYPGNFWVKLPD
ncbi:putative uncharacterized transposon-derived protein F54H12.3 [Ditylenchus destructor]|nr:putative uncharacterized transposon-derived protein F54H12.3 [Ditylenchus destructor]